MIKTTPRRLVFLGATVLVASATAAAATPLLNLRGDEPRPSASATPAPSSTRTQAAGSLSVRSAEPTLTTLVRNVVDGVDAGRYVSAEIKSPPPGFHAEPRFGQLGNLWLYLVVRTDDSEPGVARSVWSGAVVAGAVRGLAHRRGHDILGYTVQHLFPDGSLSPPDSTAIAQPFNHGVALDPEATQRSVRGRADRIPGVYAVGVALRRPGTAPAIMATLRTRNPSALLSRPRNLVEQVVGDGNSYEGTWVEVRTPDGALVAVNGYSARTGIGTAWSAEGIAPPRETRDLSRPSSE